MDSVSYTHLRAHETGRNLVCRLLLENPSNYLSLSDSVESESEFIANVIKRSGCGLLLDVNNVYISAHNCGYSATQYIEQLPLQAVGEIHLAGHSTDVSVASEPLLIDAHDREVCDAVWELYAHTICLLYTSPSPRDRQKSRMPSSA